jgi:hypothetical protein
MPTKYVVPIIGSDHKKRESYESFNKYGFRIREVVGI